MRQLPSLLLAALLTATPLAGFAEPEQDVTPSAEPDVTIRQQGDKSVAEYRINGFLYAIKVTPAGGKPYFLVRADGSDNFVRADNPDMLIPQWEILRW